MLTADQVLARARSALGHGTKYALGRGGMNPRLTHPWDALGQCDCSGYLAWCLGISRFTDNPWYEAQDGGWLETTAIVRDARSPYGFFTEVPWSEARPADVIVYGDRPGHQGHVGIVAAAEAGPTRVIHCSLGGWNVRGDAIQEEAVSGVWKLHEALIAASALVAPPPAVA